MKINIPENWNQLTQWQLPRLASAIFFPGKNKKANAFYIVLILFIKKPTLKNLWKACRIFHQVPFSQLKTFSEFLFKTSDLTSFIKIPKLCGPDPRMTNISINEFSYADAFYFNWTKKKQGADLDRLVAILYRKPENGKRPQFKKENLSLYAKQTSKISFDAKLAILLAYQGSREVIVNSHKHVFTKGKSGNYYKPFSSIINNMATTTPQPFGDFYHTREANIYDFMKILDEQILAQKIQIKRNRKK